MGTYVDDMRAPFGRMIMCHLLADSPEELHAMADRIGIARKWFQRKASSPHYDIALSKRALALKAGAIEVVGRDFLPDFLVRIRPGWPRDEKGQWK